MHMHDGGGVPVHGMASTIHKDMLTRGYKYKLALVLFA